MKHTILQQTCPKLMESEEHLILNQKQCSEVHEACGQNDSERTDTLSCLSQKLWISSQESDELPCPSASGSMEYQESTEEIKKYKIYYNELQREVEIDENDNVIIDRESFEALLGKANKMCDLNQELTLLRSKCLQKFGKWGKPITDPGKFRNLCIEAGSLKLYNTITEAVKNDRQSEQRQILNERRAISIIYMMMYGQSQQANWFQVATARTVKGLGASSRAIETLRNMGLATHPLTALNVSKKNVTESP